LSRLGDAALEALEYGHLPRREAGCDSAHGQLRSSLAGAFSGGRACFAFWLEATAPAGRGAVKEAMIDLLPDDPPEPRYTRRLSDKILIAFHNACDQGDIEVAAALLDVLEFMTKRDFRFSGRSDRRSTESLIAAHERLWQLRHPQDEQ
jgi:hypothetical protein